MGTGGQREKKGWVNKDQFTLIIRMVSLACSPRFEGKSPSMEIYLETITDRVPLPYSLIDAYVATKELTMSKPIMESGMDDASGGNASPGGRMRANSGEKGGVSPGGSRRRSSSGDKTTPTRRRSSGSKRRDSFDIEWLPSLSEEKQIDAWFDGLDTDPKNAQVGGARIVQFLVQSGLEKGVLREIWELGDKERKGWVNKKQFMLIMRLVAIALAGQPPTLEKYRATINNSFGFPLPPLALHTQAEATPIALQGSTDPGPHTTEATTPPLVSGHLGTCSTAVLQQRGWAQEWQPRGGVLGAMGPSMDEPHPGPVVQLSRRGTRAASGRGPHCGLPPAIWPAQRPPARHLGPGRRGRQGMGFPRGVRCHHTPGGHLQGSGGPPSLERYHASCGDNTIPLPPLDSDPDPAPAPSPAPGLVNTAPSPAQDAASGGRAAEWVPRPEQAAQIEQWFSSLSGGSLTIGGAKIVPFLLKSGAPKHVLRECWAIGDSDCSGSVDKDQFTVIVRLVMLSLADLSRGGTGVPSMGAYHATATDSTLPLPP